MLRVVLDANVLVSGLISKKGVPGRLLDGWRTGRFQIVISPPILAELARVFQYPRIRARVDEQEIRDLLKALAALAEAVPGALELDVLTTDPTDNVYLACAVEAGAAYLVTGNLKHYAEAGEKYRGVQILAPAAFLSHFEII